MHITHHDRFVRVPTDLLEALLRARLSRAQLNILLWVIRQTCGWNRNTAPFSWYRIARDLSMDRGGIVRAGNALLRARILGVQKGQLGIPKDYERWEGCILPQKSDDNGQLWISAMGADRRHRKSMTGIIVSDDERHHSSVGRKTGVKTKNKRRSSGGFGGQLSHTAEEATARELMNHYIALKREALSVEQTANFYERFGKSAKALLDACSGNLQEAKAVLRQSLTLTKPET